MFILATSRPDSLLIERKLSECDYFQSREDFEIMNADSKDVATTTPPMPQRESPSPAPTTPPTSASRTSSASTASPGPVHCLVNNMNGADFRIPCAECEEDWEKLSVKELKPLVSAAVHRAAKAEKLSRGISCTKRVSTGSDVDHVATWSADMSATQSAGVSDGAAPVSEEGYGIAIPLGVRAVGRCELV